MPQSDGFRNICRSRFSIEEKKYVRFIRFDSTELPNTASVYYIEGRAYPYEVWRQRLEEYHKARQEADEYNSGLDRKKRDYQIAVGIVYVINIIDALFLIDRYEKRDEIINRLSVNISNTNNYAHISLNYSF